MRSKPAAQGRSQEKHQRILAALDTLLRSCTFEDISITDIATAAKISPATIYQRFRNKDAAGAILLELYFQSVQQWAARQKPGPSGRSLRTHLLAIGRDAWDQVAALGHIMRPAYLYSRRWPDRTGEDWTRLEALAAQGFEAFLDRHAGEVTLPDRKEAAATIGFVVNMMAAGLLLHGEDAPQPFLKNREAFARELADLAFRYLTPPTEGTP